MSAHSCEQCEITFSTRSNLVRHIRAHHKTEKVLHTNRTSTCGICFEIHSCIKELEKHLSDSHEITLKHETLTFYSEDEFNGWKCALEESTTSSFRMGGVQRKEGVLTRYYMCHRSGPQKRVTRPEVRKRRGKLSGSVKIGSTCPARMKAVFQTVNEVQEIEVEYQSVHVGHDLEVKKLRLTRDERRNLATLLVMGIPKETILNKVHEEYSPLRRLGLTRNKDLHNIRRDFNIHQTLNSNDSMDNETAQDILDKINPPDNGVIRDDDGDDTPVDPAQCLLYECDNYPPVYTLSDIIASQSDFDTSNSPSGEVLLMHVNETEMANEVVIVSDVKRKQVVHASSRKEVQSAWRTLSQRVRQAKSTEQLQFIKEQIKIMNDFFDQSSIPGSSK